MIAILIALAVIARSVTVLDRERMVVDADDRLAAQSRSLERGEPIPQSIPPASPSYPARARVIDALYLARGAQLVAHPGGRKAMLDRAETEIALAVGKRPFWGEAWTVAAFIHATREGAAAPGTLQALARSYDDAPYLRYAAGWRVREGIEHWDALDIATRRSVIDEAVWLSRNDDAARDAILAAVRGTGAYRPLLLRWIAMRPGDADFAQHK